MRELKFRAWDQERGVMVYGQDIEEYEDELDEVSYTYHAPRYQTGLSYGKLFVAYTSKSGDFTECAVMQSTGLPDKNGKEIYEGDVLHFGEYSDGSGPCNHVVFWSEGDACFCTEEITLGIKFASVDNEVAIVIGNIHEHPHLLQS